MSTRCLRTKPSDTYLYKTK